MSVHVVLSVFSNTMFYLTGVSLLNHSAGCQQTSKKFWYLSWWDSKRSLVPRNCQLGESLDSPNRSRDEIHQPSPSVIEVIESVRFQTSFCWLGIHGRADRTAVTAVQL